MPNLAPPIPYRLLNTSEFSYRLSYLATAPKPYGSIPYELLNTSTKSLLNTAFLLP